MNYFRQNDAKRPDLAAIWERALFGSHVGIFQFSFAVENSLPETYIQ